MPISLFFYSSELLLRKEVLNFSNFCLRVYKKALLSLGQAVYHNHYIPG